MRLKTYLARPDSGQSRPNPDHSPALATALRTGTFVRPGGRQTHALGFTLVETILATFLGTAMMLALYACFAGGFAMIKVTREDLRATQIALERMEAIRVATYTQLKDPAIFPATTTVYFDELGKSTGKGGVPYTVTFKAEALPSPKPQSSFYVNMQQITVGVSWKSGNIQRSRSMQTYVAKYGVQGYVGTSK